jgi:hypothetical protein
MSRVQLSKFGRWALAALGVYIAVLFVLSLVRFFRIL